MYLSELLLWMCQVCLHLCNRQLVQRNQCQLEAYRESYLEEGRQESS